ncbi:thiolase family protein [Agrobacterium sp. S2]|nr:thiolase family protein [Agrobacterium sp. S2]
MVKRLRAAVVGVGRSNPNFAGLRNDVYGLAQDALNLALGDAGLLHCDIDGLITNRIPSYGRLAELCGINPRFTLATPGHGRFCGICIQTAVLLVESGQVKTIALVYANDSKSAGTTYGGDPSGYGSAAGAYGIADLHWASYGMTSPGAYHALMMQRHMHSFGTRIEHLGKIAATFRSHAALNPEASMKSPFSVEQYLKAKLVCAPLRLLDYCLINDGAVALIITSAERAKDTRTAPVFIRGAAQASQLKGSSLPPQDYWFEPMRAVANEIYARSEVTRSDIDGLMIYDNFTPTVLFSLEGFGFCPVGESGNWVDEGHLRLGSDYPANTSGGHLSDAYLQGWGLNLEAVKQIRGECGARQIKNPNFIQYLAASPIVTSVIYGREEA